MKYVLMYKYTICVFHRLTYGRTSKYHLLNPHVWPCSYTQHTIRAEIQGILFDKKQIFWNRMPYNFQMKILYFDRNSNERTK
jgi:hypothetical protein